MKLALVTAVIAALAGALAGVVGCKQAEPAAPPAGDDRPTISAAEVKRGEDACKTFVEAVCACAKAVPAKQHDCALVTALPDALRVALDTARAPDSTRLDVLQANDSVRKIVKSCIEETAKLPGTGCP